MKRKPQRIAVDLFPISGIINGNSARGDLIAGSVALSFLCLYLKSTDDIHLAGIMGYRGSMLGYVG